MTARMRGLLGRAGLEPDQGLLIPKTSSIHMFFMRFPIDAVFLDRDLRVRKIVAGLAPWRVAFAPGARIVVELPAGAAARAGIEVGSRFSRLASSRAMTGSSSRSRGRAGTEGPR